MQAIKLVVPGNYWDSQLYSKYLYLFGDSGDLIAIDWNKLINDLFSRENSSLKMAWYTAFLESNLFYEKGVQLMLHEPSIKDSLINGFKLLSEMNLEINFNEIMESNHIDNPFPFPHVDSEMYYHRMYISMNEGVFYSPCNGSRIQEEIVKIWDVPTFDITASSSYTTIAFATGSEGLFQQRVEAKNEKEPILISHNHCTSCKWTGFDIYATSHNHKPFLASFKKSKDEENKRKSIRSFDRIISTQEIFDEKIGEGFSWGVQDKIYIYQDQTIKAVRYSSRNEGNPTFESLGNLPHFDYSGDVISAEVTPFGTVIEYEDAMIIVQSNNEVMTIPGEPVNWRVFSKSEYYTNQLHIIYDDRLEIFSFYNDYFVNQDTKTAGIGMPIKSTNL